MEKKCKNCIWNEQCGSNVCEYYDDNGNDNYVWHEFEHNKDNDGKDLYEPNEMEFWFFQQVYE